MKKTYLIIGVIFVFCMLLMVRLLFVQKYSMADERKWFAKELQYEFSAKVDSVWMFNENAGRLRCMLTEGNPRIHREDSLKNHFKKHDMLYLIFKRSGDSITFVLPNAKLVSRGDSLRVSSSENTIQIFRDGQQVASDSLSEALTGFSRPFFFKEN